MTDAPAAAKTAAAWKKQSTHTVTLPSGATVKIKLPNLAKLVKSGSLPNELIALAVKAESAQAQKITAENLSEAWDFVCFIVPLTVVEPKITADDVGDLPSEDVEMIVGFAQRNIDIDAVGHQLGGLETVRSFREARGIWPIDPTDLDGEGAGEAGAATE